MTQWRSIDDNPPKDGTKVDLWDGEDRLIDCAWGLVEYDPDPKFAQMGWLTPDGKEARNVTHWMRCPEPPTNQESLL